MKIFDPLLSTLRLRRASWIPSGANPQNRQQDFIQLAHLIFGQARQRAFSKAFPVQGSCLFHGDVRGLVQAPARRNFDTQGFFLRPQLCGERRGDHRLQTAIERFDLQHHGGPDFAELGAAIGLHSRHPDKASRSWRRKASAIKSRTNSERFFLAALAARASCFSRSSGSRIVNALMSSTSSDGTYSATAGQFTSRLMCERRHSSTTPTDKHRRLNP
ncbi:MAG: hypothetical protein JWQ90_27 [Hydrocarboniphaga sp.]|nr:hypothetical protein [Hydrocarboniphaga sp.]